MDEKAPSSLYIGACFQRAVWARQTSCSVPGSPRVVYTSSPAVLPPGYSNHRQGIPGLLLGADLRHPEARPRVIAWGNASVGDCYTKRRRFSSVSQRWDLGIRLAWTAKHATAPRVWPCP